MAREEQAGRLKGPRHPAPQHIRPVAPVLPGDGAVPTAPSPRSSHSAARACPWRVRGDREGDEEDG